MLDRVTCTNSFSIGKPELYLARNNTRQSTNKPFSFISLSFLQDSKPVHLHFGKHPYLKLKESGIRIDLNYDASKTDQDIGILIEKTVIAEVTKLLAEANIQVSKGSASFPNSEFCHLDVSNQHLQGLVLDPAAIVHKRWFDAR